MCQCCIEIARAGDDNSEISEEEEMQIDEEKEEAKNEKCSTELNKSLEVIGISPLKTHSLPKHQCVNIAKKKLKEQ